jgi:hypothetical protein
MYLQGVDLSDLFRPSGGDITQKTSGTKLKILGADADILTLGDATHEGGDLKIYRNGSGDLQLSVDADAASNTKALDVYGGVVAQNYLTIGQTTLNTSYPLHVTGYSFLNGRLYVTSNILTSADLLVYNGHGLISRTDNISDIITGNILVSGTDSTDHSIKIQVDSNNIIVAQATGDGSGGITNKAVGLYGTTPTTQAAHIADPAENAAANNAAIDAILVALENIGILASA